MQQNIIEESHPVAQATQSAQPKKRTTATIPISAYFKACLRNWYWFVISVVLFTSIAYLYSKSQPFLYNSNALILLKSKDSNNATQTQAFSDLGIQGNTFMPNEIYMIRSTDVMENVVKNLGINVQYYGHVFLRDVNIYRSSPVTVTPLREVTAPFSITIVPKGGNDFEFKVGGDNKWQKANFGNKVVTPYGPIAITKSKKYTEQHKDFNVIVRVSTPRSLAKRIVGSLSAVAADKTSDVLRLSLTWDNSEEAVDILNALIATYNQEAINDKNIVARSTEAFITERVAALSKDLSGVDSQVAALKTSAANASMYADAGTGLKYADNATDVELQLALANNIATYIGTMGDSELIPSNTGIANTGIESQITQYNETMLKYQKIAATSSSENPVMIDLTRSLATIKQNIMRGLNNYINSLRMRQSQARQQQSIAIGSIVAVPSQEKAITEVTRQQKIKEQLYLYLLNKREENALQLAITEPNAKVIEAAAGAGQIAPVPSRTIMTGFLFGLLLPAIILYIIYWFYTLDTKVHTRHDVEDFLTAPIIGELPTKAANQSDHEIIVTETGHDRISEACRIIRANLDYIAQPQPGQGLVVQFTSTMSGEGKSFVAVNLALSLAHSGKRVVAVDLDLRKGRFSEYVGVNTPIGSSTYLSKKTVSLDDVIQHGMIHKNLDFICVGAIPPNPTNLLMSEQFTTMIDELRHRYDYILLDTVPYGLIADAALINRQTDLTIYVIRDGKVDKRYLDDLEKMHQEGKIKNMTVLVNDIKIDNRHYGYGGYGYGYGYGGYGYGYGYGYSKEGEEEKPASVIDRIKKLLKR